MNTFGSKRQHCAVTNEAATAVQERSARVSRHHSCQTLGARFKTPRYFGSAQVANAGNQQHLQHPSYQHSFLTAAQAGAQVHLGRGRVAGLAGSIRHFAIGPRFLALLLVALLALPMDVTLQPAQAGPQRQEQPVRTLAAKKNDKKVEAELRTIRRTVTRTFTGAGGTTIPTGGNATPYPSTINVAGFSNGRITDVNLILNGFSHTYPEDVDILLVPAHLPGQNAIVLSDVGGDPDAASLNLTLDDQAATPLPDAGPLTSGTFRPTNMDGGDGAVDSFPTQTPSGNSLLSVFTNANPNGAWQLLVRDDDGIDDSGSISSWTLEITAEVEKQVENKKQDKKDKKDKKRRDRRD